MDKKTDKWMGKWVAMVKSQGLLQSMGPKSTDEINFHRLKNDYQILMTAFKRL